MVAYRRIRTPWHFAALAATVLLLAGCAQPAAAPPAEVDDAGTPSVAPPAPSESESADDAPQTTTFTVGPGQELRVRDASQALVQCDGGGEVYVEFAGEVTITGVCEDVDIVVDGSTVALDGASAVDVDGSGNTVAANQVGELDIVGDDNTVTVQTVSDLDVEGSRNTVTFGGNPDVDDTGSGNTLNRL